jgi:AraC-like DNA-binding protein
MSMQASESSRSTRADSAFQNHWVGGYHEYAAPADLAEAIEALWTYETTGRGLAVHRVVPDAAVSLCFTGMRACDGSSQSARLRVIGPVAVPKLFAPPPGHFMAAIRIKLEWCRPLLDVRPWEHANYEPCYADICPDLAAPLEERLMRTTQLVDALHLLLAFLRQRYERLREGTPVGSLGLLRVSMESLRRGAHGPRVAELARHLGVSDRHLRRVMVDETGIAPRHFARIQRFHALLRASDLIAHPSWAALAACYGYADQSHLIREVHALTGVTPSRLREERLAE